MNSVHFLQRYLYEWQRRLQLSLGILIFRLSIRLVGCVLWVILLPFSIVLHLAGFRRVTVFSQRIGHLALEPDCLLKDQALGTISHRRWFMLAPIGKVANRHLLGYWEPHILIIRNRGLCFLLENMSRWLIMRQDISRYILAFDKSHDIYRIYSQWGYRQPLLQLSANDIDWAVYAFEELGLPADAWFACVHNREAGFSPVDEKLHAHRNGGVEVLIPAIEEIVRRGGWVVRIGDASTSPLPTMEHVIDYAHHPMKSERLDVILCAKARFMLGNTSGISFVSSIFGVPCALPNMIPTSTLGLCPHDISIPKLLWSDRLNRYLRIDEIMDSPVANYRYASLYHEAGIRPDENTSEDIVELVREMLDQLEGHSERIPEDEELQRQYVALFRPIHYSYGASSRLGMAFLRKYRYLLREN